MEEEWKIIDGFENYMVSNLGNVKSLNYNHTGEERLMKLGKDNKRKYMGVVLWKNNKQYTKKIHQLVAIAFLNHIPDGHNIVVDHKNGDKTDNNINNLQLVSQRENCTTCFNKNKEKRSSKYIGVSWNKSRNKWESQIKLKYKKIFLGYFNTELEASQAYQTALEQIKNPQ